MIIYYHCTGDSALLLLFLLTCHPYTHIFLFHHFFPNCAWARYNLDMCTSNKKYYSLCNGVFSEDNRLSRKSAKVDYVISMEVLLVKRYSAYHTESICVKLWLLLLPLVRYA